MDIAVLFLIFNRPQHAGKVFEAIRAAKPARLFVMADGPREGVADDVTKCRETRKIVDLIDWECDVNTLFFEENRGCGKAVIDGINWFFDNVEQGIILEDDCLPNQSFFPFCQELLNRYKNDARVMHINGNNFGMTDFSDKTLSYCFGSYPQAWGWASWRRAWELFDGEVSCWPKLKAGDWLSRMGWSYVERRIQKHKFEDMYQRQPRDIWDYQWHLSVFSQNGLAIVPSVNLVSNIGFGQDATHTVKKRTECSDLATSSLGFPLTHPTIFLPDPKVNKRYGQIMIGNSRTLFRMLVRRTRGIAGRVYRSVWPRQVGAR